MPKIILYSTDVSPPCRAVLLTAAALGIDLDIREINLLKEEQLKNYFKKLNPQHTLPTIDDNGFILWDSHAIICYMVNKYGKDDDPLYPKDPQKRAIIDQRLHFECGVLFSYLRRICRPIFFQEINHLTADNLQLLREAYEFMEKFLEGRNWLAGNNYTLADISCVTSISSLTVFLSVDKYPNLGAWLKRCEECLPGYVKCNKPGAIIFHEELLRKVENPQQFPMK